MNTAQQIPIKATFDPKLRLYLYVISLVTLVVTIVGIVLVPFWIFIGWWWSRRSFEALRCELDGKRLHIHRGVVFQKDMTIMLDKIQDISLSHGPLLRKFGLMTMQIETAGQSGPEGQSDAKLTGIVDIHAFQAAIIAQRDRLTERHASDPTLAPAEVMDRNESIALLTEIRDALHRLESLAQSDH